MRNITLKILIPLLIVLAGLAAMKGLAKLKKPQRKHTRPPMVKTLQVEVVEKQTLRPAITALGRVRSEHPIKLAAEVAGTVMLAGTPGTIRVTTHGFDPTVQGLGPEKFVALTR